MTPLELQEVADRIRAVGPTRVIVDDQGTAMSPVRAKYLGRYVAVDVIFIRNDGWSLGASTDLAEVAERLWPEHWVAIMHGPLFTEIETL